MNIQTEPPKLESVLREHADLERGIDEIVCWWRELRELGRPHFNEMGSRLSAFRAHLAEHMRHEEASGFLNAAAQASPEPGVLERRLLGDHRELLAELDSLSQRLQACEPQFTCWSEALAEFDAILRRLRLHEQEEVELARSLGDDSGIMTHCCDDE